MSRRETKKASMEIVNAVKCILQAQTGRRSERSCVPALKVPVARFCKIAHKQAKSQADKMGSRYGTAYHDVSRLLGPKPSDRVKLGQICSNEIYFPKCRTAREKISQMKFSWNAYEKAVKPCADEVNKEIMNNPISRVGDFRSVLTSFETMRNWMHANGYAVPDYVWNVPLEFRERARTLFKYLSGRGIKSVEDLDRLRRKIQDW